MVNVDNKHFEDNIDYLRKAAKAANNQFVTDGPQLGLEHLMPKEYLDNMRQLGEDYRAVKWLPLDIPRIEFDDYNNFLELWDTESIDIKRIRVDVAEPWSIEDHPLKENSSWHKSQFKGLTLYAHPANKIGSHSFAAKLYTGNNPQLKRIVEQTFEYFPMHTMMEIFLWESIAPIGAHKDQSSYWKCPTEFRCMLHDDNPDPTLYVIDETTGEKNYIDLPADTNSFCWSNGTHLHGSDFYGNRKILLCVNGVQHSIKSRDIFERSVAKYKNQLNYKLEL
jgi:hypothetical protein